MGVAPSAMAMRAPSARPRKRRVRADARDGRVAHIHAAARRQRERADGVLQRAGGNHHGRRIRRRLPRRDAVRGRLYRQCARRAVVRADYEMLRAAMDEKARRVRRPDRPQRPFVQNESRLGVRGARVVQIQRQPARPRDGGEGELGRVRRPRRIMNDAVRQKPRESGRGTVDDAGFARTAVVLQ